MDEWIGLHERLWTPALTRLLEALGLRAQARSKDDLDPEQAAPMLAAHLARMLQQRLASLAEAEWPAWQQALTALSRSLAEAGPPLAGLTDELPSLPLQLLTEVLPAARAQLQTEATPRPDVPLSLSALLTGSRHSPSLLSQLEKELASADRADWLVAFIKFSGIRPLREALQAFTRLPAADGGPRLRVATTSYLGATDPAALEFLLGLPNTEVRVSYDTHRTRLHAKAYLFHRRTGFGSAYVGSANVSRRALDEGLEWTARVSEHELPHLWRQLVAGFALHWEDPAEFEPLTAAELPRFREAIRAERGEREAGEPAPAGFFDLKPYAFQLQILEALAEERAAGRFRHLVVAATGTGKTLLAAFDYRDCCRAAGRRLRLLFIAHREEILKQARRSFAEVLRERDFGELVVGGATLAQGDHLFCTVQSWQSRGFSQLDPAHFEYVVIDEAHHGSADSYQRVLGHVQPRVLLGLTATPERMDGSDIRKDFGGGYSHELRLPDAVEARLLAPFHYYGIEDAPGIDLSGLRWQRGGYAAGELERVYGHNEVRARWVLKQFHEHVGDAGRVRALGFCVSQAHAEYMAAHFRAHGLPAEALTAASPRERREAVQAELVARKLRVIFAVDLYNEGVDIPEVDTILMLRPTESLTVYLQQLGRGLRLHEDKAQLTVLDFIAPQRPEFRMAERFAALSARRDLRVDQQIEAGFPWLPAGCLVRLTPIARERVLAQIRAQLGLRTSQLEQRLRGLMGELGRRPTLQEMLDRLLWDTPDLLLQKGLPSALLGLADDAPAADPRALQRGLRHLAQGDDPALLEALRTLLTQPAGTPLADPERAALGLTLLAGKSRPALAAFADSLRAHVAWRTDLIDLIDWRLAGLHRGPGRRFPHLSGALRLHAHYTREQILIALGLWRFEDVSFSNNGVIHLPERRADAFFVTLDKDPQRFSPSTMYHDYALAADRFHWQTPNATGVDTPVGQRYLRHAELGYTPLLFVRHAAKQADGLTAPFCFLGPLRYLRHEGDRPISIVWQLLTPMPATVYEMAHRHAI